MAVDELPYLSPLADYRVKAVDIVAVGISLLATLIGFRGVALICTDASFKTPDCQFTSALVCGSDMDPSQSSDVQPNVGDNEGETVETKVKRPDTQAYSLLVDKNDVLQVEVELRLLEALETYHPAKLHGMHRHFILFGLMEYLERRLSYHFTSEDVLELLDRFYNLELLRPDEEESELLRQEEDFSLPASILSVKEELKES